ncbi:hypothetical protein CLI64_12420 [Nostoc sp. CENA543]|uniref:zeta toxin family protein n=1 Tax=Nostoc sp. CENA543 TaxID=1869241 RepID=UPI000CA33240|nr:AAA family ATPase [Nostoc sp. CENA543]AUT01143.1 hypothetical protein CLI64_12420 [Nostoc sp. CENA543]
MMPPKPTLTIIAGPNGSGKSTFTRATQQALQVPIIDPDQEARQLRPDDLQAAAILGGRQAIKRARAYLSNNESFAVETTLSGHTYLRMMAEVRQKGWQIYLIYVGIDNVEISIERVATRVAQGGHNVPEEDIRRRYSRSLSNLSVAIEQADRILIFDNSTMEGYQQILTIENGRVSQKAQELPEWLRYSLRPEFLE